MSDQDITGQLLEQLTDAIDRQQPVEIVGGHSKKFIGRETNIKQEQLHLKAHAGIVNYQPTELVITARAGTPIVELNQLLATNNQMLAFEPPELNGNATLGGTLACGLSGPARPYTGSARDFVLGTHILNGKGQLLRLGGEVMKNVAGYDISRLMVGAMGTLGVILQASLKILPSPRKVVSLVFELDQEQAITRMNALAAKSLPISASCFYDNQLSIRLSGSAAGVESACGLLGGDQLDQSDPIWSGLREFNHPFFQTELPVWRLSVPAMAIPEVTGETLIEWNGTQWWLRSNQDATLIRQQVTKVGGHATLFMRGDRTSEVFHPLTPGMQKLQQRIKHSFDPLNILNRERINWA